MNKLSYKYRIYPNKQQTEILQKNFNFCCFLYNSALQERISYYKKYKKTISYFTQTGAIKDIRKEFPEQVKTIYSQVLQSTLKRVDSAYQHFFRRVKAKSGKPGFPRYKKANTFNSICFPQCNLKERGIKLLKNNKIKVFGLGEISVNWHRPYKGQCKQVQIVKQADKFYLIFFCDEVPTEPIAKTGKTIGIDLGLTSFITTDDGLKIHHPKPYNTAKLKLAALQRKLALKQRASNNRRKTKAQLAKAYQKTVNIRKDFLHKTALRLLVENDVIIIEKLNVKSMLESKGFEVKKENIQDASWAAFGSMLLYKAERAGKIIVQVDPRNTSKRCSGCGKIKENLKLSDRLYDCEFCKLAIDRDQNAAINIKRLGTSLAPGMVQKSLI